VPHLFAEPESGDGGGAAKAALASGRAPNKRALE